VNSKTLSASIRKTAGKARSFTATITTDSVDRDGEVVIPAGMNSKDYEKNPVLLYEHDALKPIGKMLKMARKDRSIEAEFALAPRPEGHTGDWLPDTVAALMDFGALNTMSIGFMGTEARPASKADTERFGEGVRRVYGKWKLLEVSVVSLPANQDAIITAVRKGLVTAAAVKRFGVTVPERPVEIKNCGTGSEGFEEGNTCQGGGSGGGGGGGSDKPSGGSKPKMPEKPPTPPKKGSAGEQWGKSPVEGLDPPARPHDLKLPKDPGRINMSETIAAVEAMGYEYGGERPVIAERTSYFKLTDESGNTREVSSRDLSLLIYGNSEFEEYRDVRVPVKRPRKHLILVTIPAVAADDRARIVRDEIARARGRIYAD